MSSRKPRLTGERHLIPFQALSPETFEVMCLWLVQREGFDRVEHLGRGGSEHGRDLVAYRDGVYYAFQCKRVSRFGPKDAGCELDKILLLEKSKRPEVLVFLVTCSVSARARDLAANRCRESGITCEVWAETELDERVRRHGDVLEQFFDAVSGDGKMGELRSEAEDMRHEIGSVRAFWWALVGSFLLALVDVVATYGILGPPATGALLRNPGSVLFHFAIFPFIAGSLARVGSCEATREAFLSRRLLCGASLALICLLLTVLSISTFHKTYEKQAVEPANIGGGHALAALRKKNDLRGQDMTPAGKCMEYGEYLREQVAGPGQSVPRSFVAYMSPVLSFFGKGGVLYVLWVMVVLYRRVGYSDSAARVLMGVLLLYYSWIPLRAFSEWHHSFGASSIIDNNTLLVALFAIPALLWVSLLRLGHRPGWLIAVAAALPLVSVAILMMPLGELAHRITELDDEFLLALELIYGCVVVLGAGSLLPLPSAHQRLLDDAPVGHGHS